MTEPSKWAALVAPLIAKTANAAEKGGATVAVLGGLTATELAAFGGLLVAIFGFVVNTAMNWYFKAQHLKLARETAKADENE
jgi:hypothetical protein